MDPPITKVPSYFEPPARYRQRQSLDEAKNYDFRSARTYVKRPNSVVDSVIHMLMFPLGTGLVTLHVAYMECGLWTGLGLNILMACGVAYCVCILVWTAQKMYGRVQVSHLTYPDLVEAVVLLSPWQKFRKAARCLRYSVEVTLALHLYGSCSVFLIMIARNLKELVEGDDTLSDAGDPPLKVYILSLMIPCVIVCMATDLKYLAPFALIADIYAVALILVTIWYTLKNVPVSPLERPGFKSVMGVFQFTSVCVFILETASIGLPLENYMDQPKKFHYVVIITMPILTAMMITTGFFGYWHYGEYSMAPITIHFPFSPFPIQLRVFLCLLLYVTFSICFYVAFDIEWFYFKRHHTMANYWFWERLYRSIHVIIICMMSYAVPNVTRLMGIVGAFCTIPIIFLVPPCLELFADWEYPGLGRFKWRLLKFTALITFGLVLFFGGTYFNTYGLILEMDELKSYRTINMSLVDAILNTTEKSLDDDDPFFDNDLTMFDNDTLFDNDTFFENDTFTIFT